jgi:hypothetical protein
LKKKDEVASGKDALIGEREFTRIKVIITPEKDTPKHSINQGAFFTGSSSDLRTLHRKRLQVTVHSSE